MIFTVGNHLPVMLSCHQWHPSGTTMRAVDILSMITSIFTDNGLFFIRNSFTDEHRSGEYGDLNRMNDS